MYCIISHVLERESSTQQYKMKPKMGNISYNLPMENNIQQQITTCVHATHVSVQAQATRKLYSKCKSLSKRNEYMQRLWETYRDCKAIQYKGTNGTRTCIQKTSTTGKNNSTEIWGSSWLRF
uniref:Uncharacterized protein n=1 Tax=Anguilla anguilla TaxID=7936 RepID=A0A0E9WGX0_ANGAN